MPTTALTAALISLALAMFAGSARGEDHNPVIVGYLPSYRMDAVTPEQCRGITDLVYFSLTPQADGTLPRAGIAPAAREKLERIRKATGCRLLVSIGGWERSEHFPALAARPESRKTFVKAIAEFCRSNGFGGVDLDWEHPKGAEQIESYARLLSDLKEGLRGDGRIVTVVQAPWQDLGKETYRCVDRVHLMSYDHEFPHATLGKTRADVERVLGWGCPAGKITLGVPFYGRNAGREALAYRDLVAKGEFDPDEDLKKGYAFNGRTTMRAKVNDVIRMGLSGIMFWEIGHDTVDEESSLLAAIRDQLEAKAGGAEAAEEDARLKDAARD